MTTFCIEWRGRITRDVGWDYVDAKSVEEAKKKWHLLNGNNREFRAISTRTPDTLDPSGE